jgi:hypothetical protein
MVSKVRRTDNLISPALRLVDCGAWLTADFMAWRHSASEREMDRKSVKAARDRKRAIGLKVEGRKSHREIDDEKHGGKMIAMAKRLRRKSPKGGRRSLRAIADELARAGYKRESGKPYAATAIGRMLGEIK